MFSARHLLDFLNLTYQILGYGTLVMTCHFWSGWGAHLLPPLFLGVQVDPYPSRDKVDGYISLDPDELEANSILCQKVSVYTNTCQTSGIIEPASITEFSET